MAEAKVDNRNNKFNDAQVDAIKVPPHSLEAEQSVIGGLLLDNERWDTVSERVVAKDIAGQSLDTELREILRERDNIVEDRFDGLVEEALPPARRGGDRAFGSKILRFALLAGSHTNQVVQDFGDSKQSYHSRDEANATV